LSGFRRDFAGKTNKILKLLQKERLTSGQLGQFEMLLGAIDDLAANIFATQPIMSLMLKHSPVDVEEAKAWIREQAEAAGQETPKAEAMVEYLIPSKS
jgi:hypothetical protein